MINNKRVTLLIPTLNEVDGMTSIMPRINREWVDQILILDGGSTDGTIEYSLNQGYEVYVQKLKGLRHGYTEVMKRVKGDIVILFSPDGNSVPELIPDLILKMNEGYDMVIVSRYLNGAKSDDDDIITGFGNWMFTKIINICHHGNYTDAMVIYRAFKKELFYSLELNENSGYEIPERLFRTKISVEPLMSIRAARRNYKISEIPGDEPARIGGERKLKILQWGACFIYQILAEMIVKKSKRSTERPEKYNLCPHNMG